MQYSERTNERWSNRLCFPLYFIAERKESNHINTLNAKQMHESWTIHTALTVHSVRHSNGVDIITSNKFMCYTIWTELAKECVCVCVYECMNEKSGAVAYGAEGTQVTDVSTKEVIHRPNEQSKSRIKTSIYSKF